VEKPGAFRRTLLVQLTAVKFSIGIGVVHGE
jgi:hypothetical protein